MRNEELMERLARDAYVLGPKRDGQVGTLWDDLPDHNRECAVQFARNVLTTLRDLGPSEEMVKAGIEHADVDLRSEFVAMLTSLLGDPR